MEIKIIDNDRYFDLLKEQWNDIAIQANSHIFQTFEWNRTWWKYFGTGRDLHIILFYEDERLVGIVPLFWDTIHFFGWKIYSCLRFLGSNVSQPKGEPLIGFVAYTDYLDVIVDPDFEQQVAKKLTDYFKNGNLIYDEILFEEVPENSMICSELVPAMEEAGIYSLVDDDSNSVNILLNNSWSDYLKSVSKNRRKKIKRHLKNLRDEENKIFELQDLQHSDEFHQIFETLVQIHQQQWNVQGFPGMFYEKRMYDFTKEISHQFFKNGWLQIRKLTPAFDSEDSCVAIDLFYMYNRRIYSIIGGIDFKSPLLSNSPGNVIFADTLQKAIDKENYEVFDYLRGLQKYKLSKGDTVTTNKKILIQYPPGRNLWRVNAAKKIVRIERRFRVEAIHFKISFREKNILNGFRSYLSFLFQRIEKKWETKNLFSNSKWILKLLLTQHLLIC